MRRLRSRGVGASVGPQGAAARLSAAGGKPGRAAASAREPRRRSTPKDLTPLTLATQRGNVWLRERSPCRNAKRARPVAGKRLGRGLYRAYGPPPPLAPEAAQIGNFGRRRAE